MIKQLVFLKNPQTTQTTTILVSLASISSDVNRIDLLFQVLNISLDEVFGCVLNKLVKVFSSVDWSKLILDFAHWGQLSKFSPVMNWK